MRTTWVACGIVVAGLLTASPARAFPIAAPGTEGLKIIVTGTEPIVATYQGNSATFTNLLYLMVNGAGQPGDDGNTANDVFIFNNQTSPVGSTFNLGSFAIGTELQFRLFVTNTSNNFFSGPASRNPDGSPHARVQNAWQSGTTLVSFEDLFMGPFNYNDLSFSFTNTSATPGDPVPEPTSLLLLGTGLLGLVVRYRMRSPTPKAGPTP
jgi:PEP-CTERM motif